MEGRDSAQDNYKTLIRMDFDLRPKRLDVYIVKKFITTFFVALLLIIGIVIIFDISEKIDDFVSKDSLRATSALI